MVFFLIAATRLSASVVFFFSPLHFQSALEPMLILMLLSCMDHLILSFLPPSWKESMFVIAVYRVRILTGGMSTSGSATVFIVDLDTFFDSVPVH